ncbi:MAG: sensor histidine kinase [Thermoleophilaceae bacterium]
MNRLRRLPVRTRLALISSGLTFVILLLFALVIGALSERQLRTSFDNDLRATAADLQTRFHLRETLFGPKLEAPGGDEMIEAAGAGGAAIRIVYPSGRAIAETANAPNFGSPHSGVRDVGNYRVASRPLIGPFGRPVAFVEYGKPRSSLTHTIARVRLFLSFGAVAGTLLAALAGLWLGRRAMEPISSLTKAARRIAQTRDPAVELPRPPADDEVADLARTLEDMLRSLDVARAETQGALERQREFVADASHELRTPLTSILANLELLEGGLQGEDKEIAASALRSSRRMRRLVADLLLLARADAGRATVHQSVDLAQVVREAVAEAISISADHHVSVNIPDGSSYVVEGAPDDLHRLVLNLVENALAHTPPGTIVDVGLGRDGDDLVLEVSDSGPGIPEELRGRIFDRFVRAERTGGGSGLGLSIVRAVAEAHDGSVEVGESPTGGARFTVRLPARVEASTPVEEPSGVREPTG